MEEIKETKDIQNIELEILKHIDQFCKKHNIKYSLCGGTLLGAIRHKGFIPWDDDIDIVMQRNDYERFLSLMDEEFKNGDNFKCLYYGNEDKYFYRFAKVVDLRTKLEEIDFDNPENLGVFVDVFPADGIDIKKYKKIIKKSEFYGRFLTYSCMKKRSKRGDSFLKSFIKRYICLVISKFFGTKYWLKKFEKFVRSFKLEDYEYCNIYSGGLKDKEIFPTNYFNELIEVDFEKSKFLAFKNWHGYLEHTYGDYMTPPPPEKRITHHSFIAYKRK